MVLVKIGPNPTLKGHRLLTLSRFPTPQSFIDHLAAEFPDLEVIVRPKEFASTDAHDVVSDEEWKEVTVLLTGSALPAVGKAPRLEFVQLGSAGANHILNTPLFRETDVAFCTANGVHGPQISEWVVSTFLAHQHRIPTYLDYQREQMWRRLPTEPDDTVGQTVGILGYGAIGRQVARVVTAMGMKVHAYTLHAKDTPESRRDETYTPPGLGDSEGKLPSKWFSGGSREDVHAFLSSGLDLLVVAVPLTPLTTGLIGRDELAILAGKRTFVSNIARGPIVVTGDLVDALNDGVIRGAALDVTDPEPLPDGHPLWRAKNVIITPHVSGASKAYGERVLRILEQNLRRLSQGRELVNRVDRKDGY